MPRCASHRNRWRPLSAFARTVPCCAPPLAAAHPPLHRMSQELRVVRYGNRRRPSRSDRNTSVSDVRPGLWCICGCPATHAGTPRAYPLVTAAGSPLHVSQQSFIRPAMPHRHLSCAGVARTTSSAPRASYHPCCKRSIDSEKPPSLHLGTPATTRPISADSGSAFGSRPDRCSTEARGCRLLSSRRTLPSDHWQRGSKRDGALLLMTEHVPPSAVGKAKATREGSADPDGETRALNPF